MVINLFFDGSLSKNKEMYASYLINSSEFVKKVFHIVRTNNIAEYLSLFYALKEIEKVDVEIHIHTDSKLIYKQITGAWEIKDKHILEIHKQILNILQHKKWKISWIPRSKNQHCDSLIHRYLKESTSSNM